MPHDKAFFAGAPVPFPSRLSPDIAANLAAKLSTVHRDALPAVSDQILPALMRLNESLAPLRELAQRMRGPSPAFFRHPDGSEGRFATDVDAWFEPSPASLRAALPVPGGPDRFRVELLGGIVIFSRVATIKGREVYEATQWHPADDPALAEPGPLWRLSSLPLTAS